MNTTDGTLNFSIRTSDTPLPYYEATLTIEVNQRLFTSIRRAYDYPWSVMDIKETHHAVREDVMCQVKKQFPKTDFIKLFEGWENLR